MYKPSPLRDVIHLLVLKDFLLVRQVIYTGISISRQFEITKVLTTILKFRIMAILLISLCIIV